MQKALHLRTTVQPRSKVEIFNQDLPMREDVDVVLSPVPPMAQQSAVDILNEAPGGLVFKTAADVAAYLGKEKKSWGR